MPKAKQDTDALQAMQEASYRERDQVVLQLSKEIKQYMKSFLTAFEDVKPDTPFSVVDIMGWSQRYQTIIRSRDENHDFQLPAIFHNAYALGKLLKKSQVELGLRYAGTYGNRAIYTVERESDG